MSTENFTFYWRKTAFLSYCSLPALTYRLRPGTGRNGIPSRHSSFSRFLQGGKTKKTKTHPCCWGSAARAEPRAQSPPEAARGQQSPRNACAAGGTAPRWGLRGPGWAPLPSRAGGCGVRAGLRSRPEGLQPCPRRVSKGAPPRTLLFIPGHTAFCISHGSDNRSSDRISTPGAVIVLPLSSHTCTSASSSEKLGEKQASVLSQT